jgi:hypothetical protein
MSINISGAVDFRVVDYNNRRFILFSDIHSGFEGICTGECLNIEDINIDTRYDNICYNTDAAIKKIILEADNNHEYVDIFFESNFYGPPPHRTLISSPIDPLDLTIRKYRDYLYRVKCPYKNARFHYTDIRQGLSKNIRYLAVVPNIMGLIEKINKSKLFINIPTRQDILVDYLSYFVDSYIVRLFISSETLIDSNLWLFIKIFLESNNYVSDVTAFLDKILIINQKMLDRFISALSHKFKNNLLSVTLNKLIQDSFNTVKKWSLEFTMIVNRNGNNITRIKSQLSGLINQGDNDLALTIQQFIYQKIQGDSISKLYKILKSQYVHVLGYLESEHNQDKSINYLKIKLPVNPLLHINSYIMDLYTIARMFRSFPVQLRKQKKSQDFHIISSYIIIYEGKAHINTITEFLQLIGGIVTIYNSSENYQRCITTSKNALIRTY